MSNAAANEGPPNPHPHRLQDGDAFGFSDAGERVPVEWPESAESARERFEDRLLSLGVPFTAAVSAGSIFDAELQRQSTALAAEKLRQFLTLTASTKLGKSIEFLAILKICSPERSLESIAAGTGHSKQRLHYQVQKLSRIFDKFAIGDE